jgi:DNA-binding transcriptional regulator PaaX
MSQFLSEKSIKMLSSVKQEGKINVYHFIKKHFRNESYRKLYTQLYQLEKRGYLERYKHKDLEFLRITDKGEIAISTLNKERDNKWKMIIFDIPEDKRDIRDVLRTKLRQLGFRKWQNSIWLTPYKISPELNEELLALSKKYFVRLVTIESINNESGLKELFAE